MSAGDFRGVAIFTKIINNKLLPPFNGRFSLLKNRQWTQK